jgi:hypothetical protein
MEELIPYCMVNYYFDIVVNTLGLGIIGFAVFI